MSQHPRLPCASLTRRGAAALACASLTAPVLAAPVVAASRVPPLRLAVDPGGAVDALTLAPMVTGIAARLSAMSDSALDARIVPFALTPGAGLGALATGQVDAVLVSLDAWRAADPAFGYFARVPLGLLPEEYAAWVLHGTGADVLERLGRSFDLALMPAGDAGPRPAGWFRRPLVGPQAFKGLAFAAAGLGADLLPHIGARAVPRAGAEDGVEAVSPRIDRDDNLSQRFPALLAPAIFSPQQAVTLAVARPALARLPEGTRVRLAAAALAEQAQFLPRQLQLTGGWPAAARIDEPLLAALAPPLWRGLGDLTAGRGSIPELFDIYMRFMAEVAPWSRIGTGAFLTARARALGV